MNILVTGGAGYIGSHACLVLAEAGYTPVTFDNLSEGHCEAVQWGPLVTGDLKDTAKLRTVIREYGTQAVMHFAASAYVGESVQNPRKYYQNNVGNTLSLLAAMLEEGVRTLVFSSTNATYGIPEVLPITEATPQQPISPYGRTKFFIEKILVDYAQAYGLRHATLRYFNVAGADPEGRIGETHDPETHLVPLTIGAALGASPPLKIFGTDYPTPDGTAIRDYVHVLDLAQAHVSALTWLLDHPEDTLTVNLGTEHGASVQEIVTTTERVLGKEVPRENAARREGDPPKLIADSRKARELLGWHPRYSLEESIRHAATWLTRKQSG